MNMKQNWQYLNQYQRELEVWLSDIHCVLSEVRRGYSYNGVRIERKCILFDGVFIELPDHFQNLRRFAMYKKYGWPTDYVV